MKGPARPNRQLGELDSAGSRLADRRVLRGGSSPQASAISHTFNDLGVPVLSRLAVFIVAATAAVVLPAQNFDFGVGNFPIVGDGSEVTPFSSHWRCSRFQQIVTASELQAQGILPGARIAST
jgi:hypothetical protein